MAWTFGFTRPIWKRRELNKMVKALEGNRTPVRGSTVPYTRHCTTTAISKNRFRSCINLNYVTWRLETNGMFWSIVNSKEQESWVDNSPTNYFSFFQHSEC